MSALIPHNLDLTREQCKRLASGKCVMMKHSHLSGGNVTTLLTPRQAMRIAKMHSQGKGMRLNMSERQVRHNQMHGGGWFDSIKNAAKGAINVVKGKAEELARNHGQALINKGAELAQKHLGDRVGIDVASHVQNYGNKALEHGIAAGHAQLAKRGYGVGRGRGRPKERKEYHGRNPNQANQGPIGVTTIGPNIVPSQLPLVPHPTGRRGRGLYA